jgi:GPH family glycoside/pentoside/hexuronide:cation symporter
MGPGLVSAMVLAPSMTADLCDLDAATCGRRREGMFNSVLAWAVKVSVTGSILLANVVLHLVGWKTELLANQAESTFLAMRVCFVGGTVVLAVLAAACIWRYTVTPQDVEDAQRRAAGLA